jgi:hypothetical protein
MAGIFDDSKRVSTIANFRRIIQQMVTAKNNVSVAKATVESQKTYIDGDSAFTAEDRADALSAYNGVNNVKVTDFVTFVTNQIEPLLNGS